MFRVTAIILALFATVTNVWAAPATDPSTFRLTPALLDRMEAVAAEVKKLPARPYQGAEDEDSDDAESVDEIARKLDSDPRVRTALSRHGLTSVEYATATLAALHAGMALAVEKAPGAAKNMSGFTPVQRANIEVMRSRKKPQK